MRLTSEAAKHLRHIAMGRTESYSVSLSVDDYLSMLLWLDKRKLLPATSLEGGDYQLVQATAIYLNFTDRLEAVPDDKLFLTIAQNAAHGVVQRSVYSAKFQRSVVTGIRTEIEGLKSDFGGRKLQKIMGVIKLLSTAEVLIADKPKVSELLQVASKALNEVLENLGDDHDDVSLCLSKLANQLVDHKRLCAVSYQWAKREIKRVEINFTRDELERLAACPEFSATYSRLERVPSPTERRPSRVRSLTAPSPRERRIKDLGAKHRVHRRTWPQDSRTPRRPEEKAVMSRKSSLADARAQAREQLERELRNRGRTAVGVSVSSCVVEVNEEQPAQRQTAKLR